MWLRITAYYLSNLEVPLADPDHELLTGVQQPVLSTAGQEFSLGRDTALYCLAIDIPGNGGGGQGLEGGAVCPQHVPHLI